MVELPHSHRRYRMYLFHNGLRVDLVLSQQFLGFTTVGYFTNCKPINPHTLTFDCLGNSIADAAGGVVIFDGDDGVVSCRSSFEQRYGINWADTEYVKDPNRDALLLQLIVCLQGFRERDASSNYRNDVLIALSEDFGFPDFKLLVALVDN